MKHLKCLFELFVLLILWFLCLAIIAGIPQFFISHFMSISSFESDMINYPWPTLFFNILSAAATLLAVYIFYFTFRRSFKYFGFSVKGKIKDIGWGVIYGSVTMLIGFFILLIFGLITIKRGNTDVILMFSCLLTLFFAAAMEEILCRGGMINICLKYYNKVAAIIISSIIFALMHIFNGNFGWVGCLNIFLLGVVMALYYVYRKNLWYPILIHLAWNYVQGPVLGFSVSGTQTPQFITQEQHGSTLLTGGEFGFEGSIIATIILLIACIVAYFHFNKIPAEQEIVENI